MSDKVVNVGAPGLAFLPARDYKFVVDGQTHILKIPIEGNFEELAGDDFPEEGKYHIVKDIEGRTVISLPVLTKALFGHSKYPDLKDDECFIPLALVISDKHITIAGKVITFEQEAASDAE